MKKILFLIIPLIFQINLIGQQQSLKLLGNFTDPSLNPIFSPNGKLVAFSKSNYKGIYIYNLEDRSIVQITDEIAAGYGMQWSADSRYILSRPAYYQGMIRYNAVKIYDVQTKESYQLTEYRTKMPSLPYWSPNNDKVIIASKGKIESFKTQLKISTENIIAKNNDIVFLIDDKIGVKNSVTGEVKIFEPIKGGKCMNLSVSPDNKRIVFEIYGGNLYSMKTDGTELVNLGKGYRAKWLKDSETLIYMISEDDGYQFTYSDIFLIKYDGTGKRNITNTVDKHEMSPSSSLMNNQIVFEVINEGSIHIMNLSQ